MSTYEGRHGKYNARHVKTNQPYTGRHKQESHRRAIAIKSLTLPAVVTAMAVATFTPASVTALEPDNKPDTTAIALAARGEEQSSRSDDRPLVAPTPAAPLKNKIGPSGVKAVEVEPEPEPVIQAAPQTVPAPAPVANYTSASCQIGVVANAAAMCEAVYANFPVGTIGGLRPGDPGDHGTGHAIDIMVGGDSATGTSIANWAIANIGTYNIKYIIWQQRTYWPASGTWQWMADRGSITANHYDHVHVSFN